MTFQSLKENNHPQIWILEMEIVDYLMIGATIPIGREILCLLYARFFSEKDDSGTELINIKGVCRTARLHQVC